jgi:hypothetical protein
MKFLLDKTYPHFTTFPKINNTKPLSIISDRELLGDIKKNNEENIEMLRAVVHRRIQDDVDKEMSKDNIVKTITSELLPF